jgi:hypothetical protein
MNQRNFLARIAAIPFLAGTVKPLAGATCYTTNYVIGIAGENILAGQLVSVARLPKEES